MRHLATNLELFEATLRERRRGWEAVASELEPYLDTQRWPSGLPLPVDLCTHAARRIRPPPWFPHWQFAAGMVALYVFLSVPCFMGLLWLLPFLDQSPQAEEMIHTCGSCEGFGIFLTCWPCMLLDTCVVLLLYLLVYRVIRVKNKALQRHVDCLYLLYVLDRADPSAPHELVLDCGIWSGRFKGMLNICAYADGVYEVDGNVATVFRQSQQPSLQTLQQQQAGSAGVLDHSFAAGAGRSSSSTLPAPPATADDSSAPLLPR